MKQKIQVGTERRPAGRRTDHADNNTRSLRLFISKESQEFCVGPLLMKRIFSLSFVKGTRYSKYNFSSHFLIFFPFSDIALNDSRQKKKNRDTAKKEIRVSEILLTTAIRTYSKYLIITGQNGDISCDT